MYIDDDEQQLFSIKECLEEKKDNYQVIGVKSGDECLKRLRQGDLPDVILLDILMPKMDGWEVHEKIRDNPKWADIPLIFISGLANTFDRKAGKIFGDGYLEKPVTAEKLIEHIEQILKR